MILRTNDKAMTAWLSFDKPKEAIPWSPKESSASASAFVFHNFQLWRKASCMYDTRGKEYIEGWNKVFE